MDFSVLLAIGFLGLSWILIRPRRSREASFAPTPQQIAEQRRTARDEVAALQVRLAEQGRELEAALQTRAVLMESLIADADERIADLRQQIEFAAPAGELPPAGDSRDQDERRRRAA